MQIATMQCNCEYLKRLLKRIWNTSTSVYVAYKYSQYACFALLIFSLRCCCETHCTMGTFIQGNNYSSFYNTALYTIQGNFKTIPLYLEFKINIFSIFWQVSGMKSKLVRFSDFLDIFGIWTFKNWTSHQRLRYSKMFP